MPIPITVILESFLHLLLLTPFFLVARRFRKGEAPLRTAGYLVLVYVISQALTQALALPLFEGQRFNWLGKGVAVVFLLLCAFLIPRFTRQDFGLTSTVRWEGTRTILIVCGLYFLVRLGLYLSSGEATAAIDPETTLFQATLPGIHEELLYRGLLLGILNGLLTRSAWPVVLTSLLFGLDHGIRITDGLEVDFSPFSFARTTFDGLLFGFLTQKTRSLLPAVAYHNLLNLIGNH